MTLGSRGWIPREQAPTGRGRAPRPGRRRRLTPPFWVLLVVLILAIAILLVPRLVRIHGYRVHPGFAPYLVPYLLP